MQWIIVLCVVCTILLSTVETETEKTQQNTQIVLFPNHFHRRNSRLTDNNNALLVIITRNHSIVCLVTLLLYDFQLLPWPLLQTHYYLVMLLCLFASFFFIRRISCFVFISFLHCLTIFIANFTWDQKKNYIWFSCVHLAELLNRFCRDGK